MNASEINTDYLVVGAGAAGMAITDELLTHSNASITIVDRRHAPGGHWIDAYPYVRLHQPSAFYGVSSVPMGKDAIDAGGRMQATTSSPVPTRSARTTRM
jgi:cation diffusion facilitator CzcD-associated flavoprotein CzcO